LHRRYPEGIDVPKKFRIVPIGKSYLSAKSRLTASEPVVGAATEDILYEFMSNL